TKKSIELPLKSGTWTVEREQQARIIQARYADPPPDVWLAWAKSGDSDPSHYCLQKFNIPLPVVNAVVCGTAAATTCVRGLGDQIEIQVVSLDTWIEEVKADKTATTETRADLVPFFN